MTHILVGTLASAKRRCEHPGFSEKEGELLIPDLMPANVASLLSIVTRTKYDEDAIPILYTSVAETVWLYQIPADVVNFLWRASKEELKSLVKQWKKYDPVIARNYTDKSVLTILTDLKSACELVDRMNQKVFIRVAL